jgi:Tfp pilus assembly protein PilP
VISRIYIIVAAALLTATIASAQPPAGTAEGAAAVPAGQQAAQSPPESPSYNYDPQGRRDPFVSLMRRGSEMDRARLAARPAGVAGLEVSELSLKGTMQSRTGYVALVEGTDKKTYIVKTGDRLLDGTIRSITANAMVIFQQVNDPLSLEKQREVRKTLRQTDEVK